MATGSVFSSYGIATGLLGHHSPMRRAFMRRVGLFAGVIAVALIFTLVLHTRLPIVPPESEQTPAPEQQEEGSQMFMVTFKCGHEITMSPPGGREVLLALLGLEEEAIVWNEEMVETSATGLLHSGNVDRDCRECQTFIFVGVKDGYVAVYKGLPRPDAVLREITDIPVSRLPPHLQEELKQGIIIRSEEELARFLEGIDR